MSKVVVSPWSIVNSRCSTNGGSDPVTCFKLYNVATEGVVDPHWETQIQEHCALHIPPEHPLFRNYTPEGLDLAGHLTFDVLVNSDDEIVTFCGVYSGGRFPQGVYRILNRTYVTPAYRTKEKVFAGLTSRHILPHQLKVMSDQISLAFVSREKLKAKHFLNRWIKRHAPGEGWAVSAELIHVAPKSQKKSAYQYVALKKFREVEWNPRSLTPEHWLRLED